MAYVVNALEPCGVRLRPPVEGVKVHGQQHLSRVEVPARGSYAFVSEVDACLLVGYESVGRGAVELVPVL